MFGRLRRHVLWLELVLLVEHLPALIYGLSCPFPDCRFLVGVLPVSLLLLADRWRLLHHESGLCLALYESWVAIAQPAPYEYAASRLTRCFRACFGSSPNHWQFECRITDPGKSRQGLGQLAALCMAP